MQPKVLIAEDDDALRKFLVREIARAGYDVAAVGDGLAALPYLESNAFDVLVADIVMPGLDGLELARRAAVANPAIRVIFITGFAAVAVDAQNMAPDTTVLSKPFHLRDLVNQIDQVLQSEPNTDAPQPTTG